MDASIDREVLALLEQALEVAFPDRYVRDHASSPVVRDRALTLLSRDGGALPTGGAPRLGLSREVPDRIGAYRITGLVGEGGMGAVYRGERATGDFDHAVAIKLVRPGVLSEQLTDRLASERQTLAHLSHPNIARLFDGGSTANGEPYIVMELVDGLPLDGWLTRNPSEAERIRLFLAICDAVGFAHQNLVIHRDLTPSNVLVTADGSPKLIDFGIARPVVLENSEDRSNEPRPVENLTMTPGYGAPERKGGFPATTLSDIYSLGRLLDRLFPTPRSRDLASIFAMASADDPEERYPSADALSEDIERWRDGKPVAARRGGRWYSLSRFLARNRVAVGAATLAFTLLIFALISTIVANTRAERARVEAEQRFAQTRSLAKTLLFDVYDQVSRVPGSTSARFDVARAGLRYLDALAVDPRAPFAVRVEAGQGYARLADVIGSGAIGALGRLADSGKLLDRAEAILNAARSEHPAETTARQALASLLIERAHVALFNDNDVPRAAAASEKALALTRLDPSTDPEAARIRAAALSSQGEALSWDLHWQQALQFYDRAEAYIAGLAPSIKESKSLIRIRATNQRLIGGSEAQAAR